MTAQESTGESEKLTISWEMGNALGSYAVTLAEFHEAEARLQAATDMIERINQGLPEGVMVGTLTSYAPREHPNRALQHMAGYNKIYRPDESGAYVEVGEICTEGSSQPFLGDRLLKTEDDQLIVINDELKLGLSVKREVFLVDTVQDEIDHTYTLGYSRKHQFETTLLPILEGMAPGEQATPDFMLY